MIDGSDLISDSYDYDAFGETINQSGSTDNTYLFAGEQFDAGIDKYYLRARYYDQGIGRFTQMDTYMGRNSDPRTLHKYLYAHADPVNMIDPTGYWALSGGFGFGGISLSTLAGYSLYGVGLVSAIYIDLFLSNAIPADALLQSLSAKEQERARAALQAKVEEAAGSEKIVYHYTNFAAAAAIFAMQEMYSTRAYYRHPDGIPRPAGAYATFIPPWIPNMTQAQLKALLYAFPGKRNAEAFVALSAKGFLPIAGAELYKPGIGLIPVRAYLYAYNLMPKK